MNDVKEVSERSAWFQYWIPWDRNMGSLVLNAEEEIERDGVQSEGRKEEQSGEKLKKVRMGGDEEKKRDWRAREEGKEWYRWGEKMCLENKRGRQKGKNRE